MKKILGAFTLFFLLLLLPLTTLATPSAYVTDRAKLLSPAQINRLETRVKEVRKKYNFDLVIATTNEDMQKKSMLVFTADYYMDNGYGFGENRDGLILLLNMKKRDWGVVGTGHGQQVFTGWGTGKVGEAILPSLKANKYNQAFNEFIDVSEKFLQADKDGSRYSWYNPYMDDTDRMSVGFLALLFATGLTYFVGFKVVAPKGMTTALAQYSAENYAKDIRLDKASDTFINTTVSVKPKPKPTSGSGGSGRSSGSFSSSRGSRHSGSSGRF